MRVKERCSNFKRARVAVGAGLILLSLLSTSQTALATPALGQQVLARESVLSQDSVGSGTRMVSDEGEQATSGSQGHQSPPKNDRFVKAEEDGDSVQSGDGDSDAEVVGGENQEVLEEEPGSQDSPSLMSQSSSIGPQMIVGWCSQPAQLNKYFYLQQASGATGNVSVYSNTVTDTNTPPINNAATVIRTVSTIAPSGSSLVRQGANALGVGTDGAAYFVDKYSTGTGSSFQASASIYLLDLASGSNTTTSRTRIVNGAPLLPQGDSGYVYMAGGAVSPHDNKFYYGYFEGAATAPNALKFHLFRVDPDNSSSTGYVTGRIAVANFGANTRFPGSAEPGGDFAFDGNGNLIILAATTNYARVATIPVASFEDLPLASNANPSSAAQVTNFSVGSQVTESFGTNPGGIALMASGNIVVHAGVIHSLRVPSTLSNLGQRSLGTAEHRDAASCVVPPTFELRKSITSARVRNTDQFTLAAQVNEANAATSTVTTSGTATGVQSQVVGPVSIVAGTQMHFWEEAAGTTSLADYAATYTCVDQTSGQTMPTTAPPTGTTGRMVTIPSATNGKVATVVCTISNQDTVPRLVATKSSLPADGEAVGQGALVTYSLTFDNTKGTATANIDYTDYLADVLDDADFVDTNGNVVSTPVVTITGGTGVASTWDATTKSLKVTGSIPGATPNGNSAHKRVVQFRVKTKLNSENASKRQEGAPAAGNQPAVIGYKLNNYLVPSGNAAPATCATGTNPGADLCTTHPMRAWTLSKNSQPEDGAMIHSGGNIYYRIKVTNFSSETITGIAITDDLTQTMSAAVIDRNAPNAVPMPNGISFYDTAGNRITSSGAAIYEKNWSQSAPVGSTPFPPVTYVPEGTSPCDLAAHFPGDTPPDSARGCWTMSIPSFTLPAQIDGAKVAYAIVGYAVKGGQPAEPGNPTVPDMTVSAESNAAWVNTIQGQAATVGSQTDTYPNRCSAADGGIPPGWNPPEGDWQGANAECKTYHLLGTSYFHLWKKDGSLPAGNENNNLLGATFVLADTQALARTGTPSRWLCRVNNNPYGQGQLPDMTGWNPEDRFNARPAGTTWVPTGSNPSSSVSGAEQFDADSDAHKALAYWNGTHPDDQKQQCGLFYELEHDDQGQAAGSWRAIDVLGGDTAGGLPQSAPLTNWRTASTLNPCESGSPGEDTCGRHGTYWLVEMKSPTDFQLLAQPMKMWVAPSSPTPGGVSPGEQSWYNYQGRLSLPVVGVGETAGSGGMVPPADAIDDTTIRQMCADPWSLPANNQPNCVMPTGWTMPIFDVKLQALPLAGGSSPLSFLAIGGAVALGAALVGTLWWRRRQNTGAESSSVS